MKSEDKWFTGVILILVAIASTIIAVFWNAGFFDFTGTEASAKIVAAAITLVGGLIATCVTVVGMFLKYSTDKRNVILKVEAEKRQKIEAATKTIDLLSTSSGAKVPETQRAAALFTLAELDLLDLAITILRPMAEKKDIDMNSAVLLIDKALKSGDETLQEEASEILLDNSDKLITEDGSFFWPRYVNAKWDQNMDYRVRENILLTLMEMLLTNKFEDWKPLSIIGIIAQLEVIWNTDTDDGIKYGAGFCLNTIIRGYDKSNIPYGYEFYFTRNHNLNKKLSKNKDKLFTPFYSLIPKYEKWIRNQYPPTSNEGDKANLESDKIGT